MLFSCRTENSGRRAAVTRRISFRDTALAKPVEQATEFVQKICRVERLTLHEPQGAAGILPAEESEKSTAGETPAAPCWRHRSTRSRFRVAMHGKNDERAFHEPQSTARRRGRCMNLQPHTLLIVSLGGYVIGAVAGLLFMRRERLANVVSFGAASLAALIGLFAGWCFLAGGTGTAAPQNELLPALNPYIRFT